MPFVPSRRNPIIGLILSLIVLFLTAIWTLITTPSGHIVPLKVFKTKISNLEIWTYFPPTMRMKQSYVIEVLLVPLGGQISNSLSTLETTTVIVTSPTPIGTPNSTFQNAFGPEYEPYAIAALYAGTFLVKPSEPRELSLGSSKAVWDWNVTPQEPGRQIISEEVDIQWKSIKNDGQEKSQTYVIGNPQFSTLVTSSEFDWVNKVILPVLIGSSLAFIAWLSTQFWNLFSSLRKNRTNKKFKSSLMKKKALSRRKH